MWWLPRMAANNFNTISATVKSYPKNQKGRYIIYVKAGVYDKYITVKKNMVNIFMYGDGRRKTMVTGNKSNREGFSTFRTATFSAIGAGFICKSIGFRNTACPEAHQAMALHVGLLQLQNGRLPGHVDHSEETHGQPTQHHDCARKNPIPRANRAGDPQLQHRARGEAVLIFKIQTD
ncbi:hypothetical protein FEM48_Zijuj01G0085600 [Ziziphus jujuba var. spinosa]|uniref:Pectinesterase catalytic domain-containing protein n=1 Tax=Ziziphus jujuba var. spinosa TaxID=714518 RepID=A0A978W079_ZIZJJ|nr:hypothetical protein FEM48_Zijuj01G0085600 [Ziziphus jujuba var. spinosa]